jgi:hypothetical protein
LPQEPDRLGAGVFVRSVFGDVGSGGGFTAVLAALLPLLAYLLLRGVRSVATWVATFRSGKREEDGRGVRVVLRQR